MYEGIFVNNESEFNGIFNLNSSNENAYLNPKVDSYC